MLFFAAKDANFANVGGLSDIREACKKGVRYAVSAHL
jgi:hypothetical protein